MKHFEHYIGGRWVPPTSSSYDDVVNPYTGKVWARVARGSATDVERAVAAAQEALSGPWGKLTASQRGDLLRRMGDLLASEAEEYANVQVQENAKPIAETLPQTLNAPAWLYYYAGLADKIEGRVLPFDRTDHFAFTRYEPLGVVAAITPWNSPLRLLLWKLAPALAAGNTLVVKPSEVSPVSTLMLAELAQRAGLPEGVVNVITGTGIDVAEPLASHPEVAKLAFTGGGRNGRRVSLAAAERFCPITLELGGKSPNIIFGDSDVDAAVVGAAAAIFGSTGQTCLAGSRLLVHESIYERVVEGLVRIAASIRHGDPADMSTEYGPIPVKAQYEAVLQHIAIAQREGASVAYGGHAITGSQCAAGLFVSPTVLVDVTPTMQVWVEEVFGPVVCVMPFSDDEEALRIANDSPYGLAAGVWTADLKRALDMSSRLKAGVVWVNGYRITSPTMPFGGYKASGLGREGGAEMIREYLQVKSVCINVSGQTSTPFNMADEQYAN